MASNSSRKRTRSVSLPPATRSACLYVTLASRDVAVFRYLLEAEDNLGYMSVVDRWGAALQVVFSPHDEKALREHLRGMAEHIAFTVQEAPAAMPKAPG